MIVKKFQAPTETEAVLKANEELGSSAVVLNVKTLKQRGIFRLFRKDVVEVTAALEEKDFISGINKAKKNSIDIVANEKVTPEIFDTKKYEPEIAVTKQQSAVDDKLDALQNSFVSQPQPKPSKYSYKSDYEDEDKEDNSEKDSQQIIKERENSNFQYLKMIYKKLIANEVDEKYANVIIGEIENSLKKESNIDSILAGVYQKIILKLGEPETIKLGDKPKVVFFIGPTGVGKTTTIAKIASLYKLEKQCKVAFIASDTYRIAAVEQLNTYASIIDCPVNVIYSPDELEESLTEYKDFDLIMIDTAGRSHKSEEQMAEVLELYDRIEKLSETFDIEVYLTLSVTTKYNDLLKIAEAYKDFPNRRLIFTKLDETYSLGNILNMRMYTNAPLSYTTSGQNVPNDIEIINEQGLAKQLLGGNE